MMGSKGLPTISALSALLPCVAVWLIASAWCAPVHAIELKVDMIQLDPWTIPDAARPGQFIGLVPDVMQELEKRTGHKITGKMVPYGRVENDLELGVIDFAFMAWGAQRARYAKKGAVGFPLTFGVMAVKGVSLKRYADLKGIKISVTRGLKVDPRFDVDASLDKSMDLDYTVGIKKAGMDRVHAIAGSRVTLNHIIAGMGLRDKFGDFLPLTTADAAISYSKKSLHIAQEAEINNALMQIVADGTMQRILKKWLDNE